MGQPTIYQDSVAVAARASEVPLASFANGMNLGGSCAPGLGINMEEGEIVGTPEQFTLLDQDEAIRVPQVGQQLGGSALGDGVEGKGTLPILTGENPTQAAKDADPDLDGTLILDGTANLQTLAVGWVATII